jgi:protein O-GlcNAc transferase
MAASSSSTMDLQNALALHRRGAVAEAAARYVEVLRADPANADAHYYLGLIACQGGCFAEGAELARQTLARDPQHARAHVLLGRALSALGRHEEALDNLKRAIVLAPGLAEAHSHCADVLSDLGCKSEAIESYDRAVLLVPNAVEDWCNRGLALDSLGRHEEAISSFDRAIACRPEFARAYLWRAKVLSELSRYDDALVGVDKALAIEPNLAEAWLGRGNILNQLKHYDDALGDYEKALASKSDLAEAWLGRGNALTKLKRHDEALADYEKALASKSDLAEAWLGRGNVFTELKRYDDALGDYEKALALRFDLAEAWLGRGNVLFELKRYDDAIILYDRALGLRPDLVEGLLGRGNAFSELKRYNDALAAYDKALTAKPELAEVWCSRGNVFTKLKRYDAAIVAYDQALALTPHLANAWLGRGNVFYELKQLSNASAAYDQAIALKPELPEAWLGRGNVLTEFKQHNDALAAYDKALTLRPDYAEAFNNRGVTLQELKRFDEALASYEQALRIQPNSYSFSGIADCALTVCDWSRIPELGAELALRVVERKSIVTPFTLLGYSSDAALQLKCAQSYLADKIPIPPQPLWSGRVWRNDKIRIAYLSADFHRHATAYLMAELFEFHDRSRFEVLGISFGPDDKSDMRSRLIKSFDQFHEVSLKGDRDVAQLVNKLQVHIAVDLKGYTSDSRPGILAHRPVPIQVNYLGYPGTMGADFIDYVIADKVVLPFDQQPHYTEKIVHLPGCYQVNDSKRKIAGDKPKRHEAGLPERGFVFCGFNSNYKITAPVFEVWMRLLRAIDGSVLWLLRDNNSAEKNLRREAAARGIDPMRLVFAARTSSEDHLARHCLADLFLDTLPYNAHTTASDALWAGLPILTCCGASFPGRVAASLLNAIGLPQLVTYSLDEYETLALQLAQDAPLLNSIRAELARNREVYPLFNAKRFARHLETAYVIMCNIWQRSERPRSFSVAPTPD